MKKLFLIATATAVLGFTNIASAADMPVKARSAPAVPVASPFNWYGFYIGIQGGYAWGRDAIELTPDAAFASAFASGAVLPSLSADPRGALGGIQFGSNWQYGHLVLGTASDFSFSDIKASQTSVTTVIPAGVTNLGSQKLEWLSTSRVRAGYTVTDNVLLYGTGGLADGRARASSSALLT